MRSRRSLPSDAEKEERSRWDIGPEKEWKIVGAVFAIAVLTAIFFLVSMSH